MKEPAIEPASDTWQAVDNDARKEINRLRKLREDPTADLRSLDQNLGGIRALESLLKLPERQNKKPAEPIRGSGIRIPGVNQNNGVSE